MVARGLSTASPGIAARLAERLFLTPPATPRPEREDGWTAGAARQVVRTDAGELTTWTWGDGPRTVLLVHGWAGRGLQLGAFARPLAETGWRVVAHDGPGHGETGGRTSSMVEIARGAAATARAAGGVDVVIGHSLGATATIFAAGRGELNASRFVAVAPPADLAAVLRRFGATTGFTEPVLERLRRRIARRYYFDWTSSEPLAIAPRMGAPLLVVHDRDDRFVPFAEGAALVAAWPGAELLATAGLGHHRLLRDPDVVARVCAFVHAAAVRERLTA